MNDNMELISNKKVVGSIPLIECYLSKNKDKKIPLVICSHGFGSRKEEIQYLAKQLAREGYFIVSPDNRCHGERINGSFFNEITKDGKIDIFRVRQLIKETADDVVKLIDYYNNIEYLNIDKIGMLGISMGGFATFRVGIIDDRVKVLVPLIASPYWDEIPVDIKVLEGCIDSDEAKRYFNKYAPSNYMELFMDKYWLIQIGGKDNHYNYKRVDSFYKNIIKKLDECNKEKDCINFVIYNQLGHEVNDEMIGLTKKWFRKHF